MWWCEGDTVGESREGGTVRKSREEGSRKASIVPAGEAIDRPSSWNSSMSRHPATPFIVLLSLLLLISSCGYGFRPSGGIVPEGAKNIAILTFVNNTNEPYVDVEVTKAVVNEFIADGRLQVVGPEGADMVLRGTVTAFNMIPQSYTVDSYVQQYMVSIIVAVSLEDIKAHKILLQEKGISSVFISSYPVSYSSNKDVDITATKIAKDAAVKKASQDIALTLRSRVLEGF